MSIMWRWRKAARAGERAFSLLEVIVALAILAMSILFITRAFLILLQETNRGGNVTVASALAVRRMEQLRAGPEAQNSPSVWVTNWTNIVAEGSTAFPAPYGNYTYQVFINQVTTSPASPAWLTGGTAHPNMIKWITVQVTYQGQVLAQVTSAVIREMYSQ